MTLTLPLMKCQYLPHNLLLLLAEIACVPQKQLSGLLYSIYENAIWISVSISLHSLWPHSTALDAPQDSIKKETRGRSMSNNQTGDLHYRREEPERPLNGHYLYHNRDRTAINIADRLSANNQTVGLTSILYGARFSQSHKPGPGVVWVSVWESPWDVEHTGHTLPLSKAGLILPEITKAINVAICGVGYFATHLWQLAPWRTSSPSSVKNTQNSKSTVLSRQDFSESLMAWQSRSPKLPVC